MPFYLLRLTSQIIYSSCINHTIVMRTGCLPTIWSIKIYDLITLQKANMSTNRTTDAGYAFHGYNIFVNIDVADFVNWMNNIRTNHPTPTNKVLNTGFEYN